MAEPAKALLDVLYLSPAIRSSEDLEELRLNQSAIQESVPWEALNHYAALFDSPTLNKRLHWLKKIVYANPT